MKQLAAKGRAALRLLGTQGFPWHFHDQSSFVAAHRLRTTARHLSACKWPWFLRPFAAIGAIFVWPIVSYREARTLLAFSNLKAAPKDAFGKAFKAALRHNVPATEYGAFGAWHASAAPPDSWLYTREASLLTAHLTARSVSDLVGDKQQFACFCERNGSLDVVRTLRIYREGQVDPKFDGDLNPTVLMVSKPVRASMGRGLEYWELQDGNITTDFAADQVSMSVSEFHETLCKRSLRHPSGLILQPALTEHACLSPISGSGPAVARIITGRWKDDRVEVLNAMLQKPMEGARKTHAGPFRLIEPATGAVLARCPGPHIFPTATDDPSFDQIALPDWNTCIAGLIELHSKIDGQAPLLGWDIVFTPTGPTILEANTTLAPYFFQLAAQKPAADGKWVDLLAEYLP